MVLETVEALAVIDVLRRAKINVITVSITGDKLVEMCTEY